MAPAPIPVVPAPTPVPPDSPGPWAWVVARFRPFANSIKGWTSNPELVRVFHNSGVVGVLVMIVLQLAAAALMRDAAYLGSLFGPFAGAMTAFFLAMGQALGKAADNTGPDGRPVAASVPRPPDDPHA